MSIEIQEFPEGLMNQRLPVSSPRISIGGAKGSKSARMFTVPSDTGKTLTRTSNFSKKQLIDRNQ